MDLGRFLVRVLMLCLIGTTSPSSDGSCSCSEIPKMALTNPPEETCNGTANKFRYVCVQGYVRKAGTSNLLKCQSGQWASSPDLSCIPDPKATNKPANSSAQPNITTQAPLSLETSISLQNKGTLESARRGTNENQISPGTQSCAPQNSTCSPVATTGNIDAHKGTLTFMATGLGIGSTVVILTFTVLAIFLLWRRKTTLIPPPSELEIQPMNGELATVP